MKDQEELGFIFHVWDVARGQGALNPSGMRSLGGTHDAPLSTAAPPRAGPSLPARDGATTPRDTGENTKAVATPRWHRDAGKGTLPEPSGRSGLALGGPQAWLELGGSAALGSPAPGRTYKGWAPPARLMLDLSVVLAARLSQFQQPVATATEL